MSRIGKIPVPVPAGVTVTIAGGTITLKGPKGQVTDKINPLTSVAFKETGRTIEVTRNEDTRRGRAAHGLQRALVANMVEGVSTGYTRGLEVHGTGYTVEIKGKEVVLQVGYALPARIEIPAGVTVEIQQRAAQPNNPAKFTIAGSDRHVIGQFAANIRRLKPPEPYNGKGIRYANEQIRRKEGKAAMGAGGASR